MTDRLTKLARELHKRQTAEEKKLWARLRDRRLNGLKFRRQVPCGPYVADFLCEAAMLIVELDGSQHAERQAQQADASRTAALNALGYEVFRVWNLDIKTNIDGVLDGLLAAATLRLSPSSAPSGHLLREGEGSDLSSPGTGEDVVKRQVRDLPQQNSQHQSPLSAHSEHLLPEGEGRVRQEKKQ